MASAGGSIKDRILARLAEAGPPLDDDQIATRIGVVREQVNDRCRQLARSGLIVRGRNTDGKIVNRRAPSSTMPAKPPASSVTPATGVVAPRPDEPSDWFWEGRVQARLRDHFVAQGWRVLREADCLSRERGIDLLLERHGAQLAIEVKGFPSTTYGRGPLRGQPKPTQPTLQAKHWFAEVLLAAIRIQSKHPEYAVAAGFPDMPRYRSLIESTGHALTARPRRVPSSGRRRHCRSAGAHCAQRATLMHERFRMMVEALQPSYEKLLAMPPVSAAKVQLQTPCGGVYLFSEGDVHLYAGRTKRPLGRRIRDHFGPAPDCPLAWLLTREATGKKATYKREGSRKALLEDPAFRAEYDQAKQRIRAMSVRWVVEADPTTQALLEVYVAIATGARYNDFDTH